MHVLARNGVRKGRTAHRAERILEAARNIAGRTGLFSEAVDPRARSFLGNAPLLFSHVEYVRAVLATERARRDGMKKDS